MDEQYADTNKIDEKNLDVVLADLSQRRLIEEDGNTIQVSDQGLPIAGQIQDCAFNPEEDGKHKSNRFWVKPIFLIVTITVITIVSTLAVTKGVEENAQITRSLDVASSSDPIWQRLNNKTFDVDLMLTLQIDSNSEDLEKLSTLRQTPQFLAANWIVNEDARELQADDPSLIQRYILAILYFATNGSEWDCFFTNDTVAFLDENDECGWFGMTCLDGALDSLNLEYCDLDGTIPKELTYLDKLEILKLNGNFLSRTIPEEIGTMEGLLDLDLSENFLTGTIPEKIYGLRHIDTIAFSWNELSGTISDSIGFSNARGIALHENSLSGTLPPSIGEMNQLSFIYVDNNLLNGTLPKFKNTSLVEILLYNNMFDGPFPDLRELKNLELIDFDSNFFTGTMSDWIYDLKFLQQLRVANNHLTGTISTQIGQLQNLAYLDMSKNKMNGTIPDEIGELTGLTELIIRGNDFSGTIPTTLGSLSDLQKLWMHFNPRLGGAFPDEICDITLHNNLTDLSSDCLDQFHDPVIKCDCCQTCCDPMELECVVVNTGSV